MSVFRDMDNEYRALAAHAYDGQDHVCFTVWDVNAKQLIEVRLETHIVLQLIEELTGYTLTPEEIENAAEEVSDE